MHLNELVKIKPYETIEFTLRRHWIAFVPTVALFSVLAVLPAGVYFIMDKTAPNFIDAEYVRAILTLALSVYELSVALFFYASFIVYYLDMLIITNDRLVDVSQGNLFARTVSELDLYRIQDATSDVKGFFPTMFNYGTLEIQTAGEQKRFIFEKLHRVHNIRRSLIELAEKDRKHHGVNEVDEAKK